MIMLGFVMLFMPLVGVFAENVPAGLIDCDSAHETSKYMCVATGGTPIVDHKNVKGDSAGDYSVSLKTESEFYDALRNRISNDQITCVKKKYCTKLDKEDFKKLYDAIKEIDKKIAVNEAEIGSHKNAIEDIQWRISRFEERNDPKSTARIQEWRNALQVNITKITALEAANAELKRQRDELAPLTSDAFYESGMADELQRNLAILQGESGTTGRAVYTPDFPDFPAENTYTKPVFEGPGLQGGASRIERDLDDGIATTQGFLPLVVGWLRWSFPIVALLAVIAVIYAGFLFIFYYGDESRVSSAKNIILYVIIGIVLVFAAYSIVNTIISAFN